MAKQQAVWGIDIGQCAVKALRCVPDSSGTGVVAEAFDYIEYPKVLSQPDAEPEVLIKEALEQFLSRNEVRGDKVAISVSGQAGLSRFFKPPPVDPKTLPDIVKYEAKQQIPFQLEDVIWDFQQIGGTVIDGLTVDAEIGIFAMKRDAVFKALQPFTDAEIEVDVIQLSPLAIYNVVLNEVLRDVPEPDEIDPNNPPESLIVLSMGTDTTDLVITDGIHLWQRNIPIGGNHFTKQLSRELKLTYAKAEQLKRNALKAEDPKTILQAMSSVYNDLVTEIQRSISYFQGINKKAKMGQVLMLGNAAKLAGLRQKLNQTLSAEILKLKDYKFLAGESVTSSKQFGENALSYAVAYGLCLQTLGQAKLDTNLLPHEFVVERLIRAKKPWALAGVGGLLLACSIIYFSNYMSLWNVHPDKEIGGQTWSSATNRADGVVQVAQSYITDDKEKVTELEKVREIQTAVAGQAEGRNWAELYSAVYQVRPRDPRIEPGTPVDPKIIPYEGRQEIYIDSIETVYFPELEEWLAEDIKDRYIAYLDQQRRAKAGIPPAPEGPKDPIVDENGAPVEDPANGTPDATATNTEEENSGALPEDLTAEELAALEDIRDEMKLEGTGWVIQIKGHHYNNGKALRDIGENAGTYVKNTFISQLENGKVTLPIPAEYQAQFGISKPSVTFTMKNLGIRYPVLTADPRVDLSYGIPNPDHPNYRAAGGSGGAGYDPSGAGNPMGGGAGAGAGPMGPMGGGSGASEEGEAASDEPVMFPAPRYDFTIQFAWQPVGLLERLLIRQARQEKRQNEGQAGTGGNSDVSTLD